MSKDIYTGLAITGQSTDTNSLAVDTTSLVVKQAGSVGINKSSPTAKLHIEGAGTTTSTDALRVDASGGTALMLIEDGGDIGINTSSPSAYLHVVGSTTDGDEAFRVDAGGGTGVNAIVVKRRSTQDWTGIATATVSGTESLRVGGNALYDLRIGVNGNAPTSQGGISTPLNTNLAAYGGVRTLWHETTDGVHMQSVGTFKLNFDVSNGNPFMQLDRTPANVDTTNFFGTTATVGDPINEVDINLVSHYWDGAADATKTANILHNITASPAGVSQIDFSVSGSTILSMLDTGNVGIGTTTPDSTLQLGETANTATFKFVDGNQGAGKVLTSDAAGGATWSAAGGGSFTGNTSADCITNLWVSNISGCSPVNIAGVMEVQDAPSGGKVGINNSSPTAKLHIISDGDTSATDALIVVNSASTALLHVQDDGRVGMGRTSPSATLHILGGSIDGDKALQIDAGSGAGALRGIVVRRNVTVPWVGIGTQNITDDEIFKVDGDSLFTETVAWNWTTQSGLSGNQTLGFTSSAVRLSADSAFTIEGISGGTDGLELTLVNIGVENITLGHQDGNAAAADRMIVYDMSVGGFQNTTLNTDRSVTFKYDATSSRWRQKQNI